MLPLQQQPRDLGLPLTTGFWCDVQAFRFSDKESGPWPAEWN